MNITEVEGIGPEYGQKLADAGIHTTEELLEQGATPRGRTGIEAATGISGRLILEWVNHADLMRIAGVGSEYADLLEAAGVDSPAELAHRNPANLATTFQEIDAARPNWIRRVPSEAMVAAWIEEAKGLGSVVSHGGGSAPAAPAAATPTPAPAPSPAPGATAPTAAAPAPKASAPAASPAKPAAESSGVWARIKRLFGQ